MELDKNELAYKLIAVTAEALRQLAGNEQLPPEWKNKINSEFKSKRGAPKQLDVTDREIEIAIHAEGLRLFYEIFYKTLNDKQLKKLEKLNSTNINQSYSASIEELGDEFGLDRSDIFKIIKKYKKHPTVEREVLRTVCAALKDAGNHIEEPHKSHIENLLNTVASKHILKTEPQRVSGLVQAAEQLGFGVTPPSVSGTK